MHALPPGAIVAASRRPRRPRRSVGKWDDGALVVKTTLVDRPYFDTIGSPQSKAAAIEERYTLSADQTRLDYHVTITDPANLVGPATVDSHWAAVKSPVTA